MAKIASPIEPLFDGPAISAERVDGWSPMIEQLTERFGDFDAPAFAIRDDGVAGIEVGKLFYAIAPDGDPYEGEKRLYLRTSAAPFFADQGDGAAPLNRPTLARDGGAGLLGMAGGGTAQDALAGVAVGLVGDGVTDNLAAINALFAQHDEVTIRPSKTGAVMIISDTLVVPAGKTLRVHRKCELKLVNGSTAECVVRLGNAAAIYCDGTLNGNLSNRPSAVNMAVWGVIMRDVADCICEVARYKDVGTTAAGLAADQQNGGAALIDFSAAATADVSNNYVGPGRIVDSVNHGFMARIVSRFPALSEGYSPYYCQYNTIRGLRGPGGNKNVVELAGPHTRFNTVEDVVAVDPTGQAGFECDFGAYGNIFRRCVEQFSSGFTFARSHSAFNNASNVDVAVGGTQKYTRDNVWEDCRVSGGTVDGSALNICGVGRSGTGARFIRPVAHGQQRVGSAFINGLFVESVDFKTNNIVCEAPQFSAVTFGLRTYGSAGHGSIAMIGGRVVYASKMLSVTADCIVDAIVFDGVAIEGASAAIDGADGATGEYVKSMTIRNCRFVGQLVTTVRPQARADCVLKWAGNVFACGTATGVPVTVANNGANLIDEGGNVFTTRVPAAALNGNNERVTASARNHVTNIALMSPIIGSARVARTAAPISGTYTIGDRWVQSAPVAGGVPGGVCTASGTAEAISVVAITEAGSPIITVDDASTLKPGQYVQLAGAFTLARILTIVGTTVTLSVNAAAATTGAMTNRPFTFKNDAAMAA